MSNEAITWAWKVVNINPGQKLVLVAIADNADDKGWAFPGQELLAQKCCMNRSTVNQHVKALELVGLLTKKHRSGEGGHRTSNGYLLHLKAKIGKTNVEYPKVGKTNVGFTPSQSWDSQQEPSENPQYKLPTPRASEAKPSAKQKRTNAKPSKTSAPDHFPITQQMLDYASEKGISDQKRLEGVTEAFLQNHRAKGNTFADWYAAWQTWLRNEVKWHGKDADQNKNPAGATTSAPGRAQPQQQKGRTHENYSRPRNRAERCESAWERNVEALERSLAEEAEAELDRRTVDEASCDIRGEVVRLLPRKNARHG